MATKQELLEALDDIKDIYDAFYIHNKYGENTHQKQFDLLEKNLKGDKVSNAIAWIKGCYDCYYKYEFEDETGTAFGYLRSLIKEMNDCES